MHYTGIYELFYGPSTPFRFSSTVHYKKRLSFFPSPAGMSLTKLPWTGNFKLFPARESLVRAGDGKNDNLFTVYVLEARSIVLSFVKLIRDNWRIALKYAVLCSA